MRMTLEDFKIWTKSFKVVDYIEEDVDSSGNEWETRIFASKDGKLYRVDYLNDYPLEKLSPKGYIRGEIPEPIEVIKKTRMVEEVYYE